MRLLAVAVLTACTTAPPSPSPTPPDPPITPRPPLPPGRALAIGGRYACARVAGDQVACWGGLDAPNRIAKPMRIPGVANVAGIAMGDPGACAWHVDGRVSCWFLVDERVAGDVIGLGDVVQVVGGESAFCARQSTGDVACWTTSERPTPARIAIGDAIDLASAGGTFCARRKTGAVACWNVARPNAVVDIAGARGATFLGGGVNHRWNSQPATPRFAAIVAGKIIGWNANDGTPWQLPALPAGTTQIAIGRMGGCATGASAVCWGIDESNHELPAEPVLDSAGMVDLALGDDLGCAITAQRRVVCWGRVASLGIDAEGLPPRAVDLSGLTDVTAIARVGLEVCAKTKTRTACLVEDALVDKPQLRVVAQRTAKWSHNRFRTEYRCARSGAAIDCKTLFWRRGDIDERTVEQDQMVELDKQLAAVGPIVDLLFHEDSLYVLARTGDLFAYGLTKQAPLARLATDMIRIVEGAGYGSNTDEDCGLTKSGKVMCWRTHEHDKSRIAIENATELTSGNDHVCALRSTGTVACWAFYEIDTAVPQPVPGVAL